MMHVSYISSIRTNTIKARLAISEIVQHSSVNSHEQCQDHVFRMANQTKTAKLDGLDVLRDDLDAMMDSTWAKYGWVAMKAKASMMDAMMDSTWAKYGWVAMKAKASMMDAMMDSMKDATRDATRDSMMDAMRDATRDAMRDATKDATWDATAKSDV